MLYDNHILGPSWTDRRKYQSYFSGTPAWTSYGRGKAAGCRISKRLQDIPLDAILSSDLQRVIDTVRLAVGDRNLPWQTTPLLREIDWGSWTGLPLDSVDRTHLPADAETREMLYERAGKCLEYIRQHYEGKCILVVAHGLINRSLRAYLAGIPVDQLTTVPHMDNCEVVRLTME